MDEITVGSLFSGIGGIELGLERAGGFKTLWFVENEPYATAILRRHWPTTPIYADVTKLDFHRVPRVDLLTGGFPCQDISNAGKRAGITGSRSGLWAYCVEAVRAIRPRLALFENVSALINRGLDHCLSDLAEIGYDAEWYCLSASAVGAPHRRERIAILAYPQLCGCVDGQAGEQSDEGGEPSQPHPRQGSEDVADTDGRRVSSYGTQRNGDEPSSLHEPSSCRQQSERMGRGWWAVEPDVGRVAHGVPNRVDRIKCLGNAVVPAWAEAIGKAIKERMREGC